MRFIHESYRVLQWTYIFFCLCWWNWISIQKQLITFQISIVWSIYELLFRNTKIFLCWNLVSRKLCNLLGNHSAGSTLTLRCAHGPRWFPRLILDQTTLHSPPILFKLPNQISPLTPRSDQDRISPYNTNTISTRQVMRVKETINLEIISWSNTKFFELTL